MCKYLLYVVRYVRILFYRVLSASYQYFVFSEHCSGYCSRYCSNGQKHFKTARICSKRLYWFLGLYKDISNSLEPPLNILQSPQIVVILFILNLFIKYSFVSLRAQIVVISFEILLVSLSVLHLVISTLRESVFVLFTSSIIKNQPRVG